MRPDAYIFDDGAHFEVRTVQEEDELDQSHENLAEQHQQSKPSYMRKVSIISEDSDIFVPDKTYAAPIIAAPTIAAPATVAPVLSTSPKASFSDVLPKAKPPYLNIQTRQTTTSTESKDTLTPIEAHPIPTIEKDEDEASTENIMELNFETARQKALRRRAMGRRNSESCSNYDLNRSQTSLNAALAMSRRQLSLTQSEPDSGNELPGKLFRMNFFFDLTSKRIDLPFV